MLIGGYISGIASHRYYFGDNASHKSDLSVCNVAKYQTVYVNLFQFKDWITKTLTQTKNIGKTIKPCKYLLMILTVLMYGKIITVQYNIYYVMY